MSNSIIVPLGAENSVPAGQPGEVPPTPSLHALFPKECAFFKRVFVWSSQPKGFYTRHRYDPLLDAFGRPLPKWRPFKTRRGWQHLYPQLVDSLTEKHLDFQRFCLSCDARDWLKPADSETAFWLGTMAGTKTYADCIDLDSHDLIGWNPVPTRWHENRTGWMNGPYSYRFLPVIRPSLRFFKVAKVIYDTFPRRIWTFSSANCGLAVWQVNSSPLYTHNVYPAVENRLCAAGLGGTEHYPCPPQTQGSFGKCHRRPCGMDSGIITGRGVITDPIEQVRAFMAPPKTPPFEEILAAYWHRLDAMYDLFLSQGESLQHTRMTNDEKRALIAECRSIVESVKEWSLSGHPIDWATIGRTIDRETTGLNDEDMMGIRADSTPAASEPISPPLLVRHPEHCTLDGEPTSVAQTEHPPCFALADVKAVAGSSQWVQYVKFLVENGFPAEDKFCEVISTLALWFGFVELFGEERQRIKEVLHAYVTTRHNDKITRLLTGSEQEVLAHVDRIVDHVLEGEHVEGKRLFAELRQKRAAGHYREVYRFEQIILGKTPSSPLTPNDLSLHLICEGLISQDTAQEDDSKWRYQPDLTPLPDEIISRIRSAFAQAKQQLRRNKTSGRFMTIDAITKLINYVFSGRTPGARRASQKLLVQMGFNSNGSKRGDVFAILEEERLLYRGGYLSRTKSRLWTLDKTVIESLCKDRSTQSYVAS